MEITLIRDLNEGYYFVQITGATDKELSEMAKLAQARVKVVLDKPVKLLYTTDAAAATVAAWLTGNGLHPTKYRNIMRTVEGD